MANIRELLSFELNEITTKPEVIGHFMNFPITASILTGMLIILLTIIVSLLLNPFIKVNGKPGKVQTALEIVYTWVFDLTASISGNRKLARQIMPIIISIFLYVLLANTITIWIPFLSTITYNGNAIFVTSTKDLNTTLGIAITVILSTHVMSILKVNIFGHIFKFIKFPTVINGFKKGPVDGILSIIDFMIGGLDIISEFAKTLSISLRLFGNMFAGEVLMSLMMSAVALGFPVLLFGMGIFSGVLQAIVFAALSASYFGGMVGAED